jgi:Polyketide cyclase / dehydrase and lipid transport
MLTVEATQDFALPLDDLWDIIGDFGDTGRWSGRPPEACVQEGEGIGALRTLYIQDGREIVDRLEAQTDYSYSYSIVTSPLPYKSYRATMSVEPIDQGHSRFRWTGEFEPDGLSDADAIAFTQNVYNMGIAMMRRTIEG